MIYYPNKDVVYSLAVIFTTDLLIPEKYQTVDEEVLGTSIL